MVCVNCPNCGAPLNGTPRWCYQCGSALNLRAGLPQQGRPIINPAPPAMGAPPPPPQFMPEDWTSWKIRVFWAWIGALIGSYFPIQALNLAIVRPLALGERVDSYGNSIFLCLFLGAAILSVAYLKIPKLYFYHPYTASRFRAHLGICLWIGGIAWGLIFLSEIGIGVAARMHANDAPGPQITDSQPKQYRWRNIQTGQTTSASDRAPDNSGLWQPFLD